MEGDPNLPIGPMVLYMARANDLNDHPYAQGLGTTLTNAQMHEYLRSTLVLIAGEHRKRYGVLGCRPLKMQTIVHNANSKISRGSKVSRYIWDALEEARASATECIIVLNNWDGWTTDPATIGDLCTSFPDVRITLRVYASTPREFYDANAHTVNIYLEREISVNDAVVYTDRDTGIFIRMFEALGALHYQVPLPWEKAAPLAQYDSRLAIH
ncbi:uncharacterized protein N7511_005940 [Penicillium nucicola]|uniref:uncharacterized protein n=1 Tax=Penicillium nucicola TaxID=1850975 RepID=UPI0025451E07|nr:uncharacterized protein N7511_005940 [Penicillium nucicola]KAJ5762558.1 hypothetical protein N7511_005940 [Penicillium nucicola]